MAQPDWQWTEEDLNQMRLDTKSTLPPKSKLIIRVYKEHDELCARHNRYHFIFKTGEVEEWQLVTLHTKDLPSDLWEYDFSKPGQQDFPTQPHMWHKTILEDFNLDTHFQAGDITIRDFSPEELLQLWQQAQQILVEKNAQVLPFILHPNMGTRNASDLDKSIKALESWMDCLDFFQNFLYGYRYLLPKILRKIAYEQKTDLNFKVPAKIETETLVKLLNQTIAPRQRALLYEGIIDQEDFTQKAGREALARAAQILSQIQVTIPISKLGTIVPQDIVKLYQKIYQNKIVVPGTEKGQEIDLTNATEATFTFSPSIYAKTSHVVSNIKTGKRVLRYSIQVGKDQHQYTIRGDKRLKHKVLDRPGYRLQLYGNTLLIKPETLAQMAYEARKIRTLCVVNPLLVLETLKMKGVSIIGLENFPREIEEKYERNKVFYQLVVQRLFGLESSILEDLITFYKL